MAQMYNPLIEVGKPKFYYDPYIDIKNRVRTKIVCVKKIIVRDESGMIIKTNYAYGSAAHCLIDKYRQKTGEKIAKERADKILEYFTSADHDFEKLREKYYDLLNKHELHMKLLGPPEFEDLEKKLLPFREKPKDEKVNITTLYDKADFGDKSMEEVAGIKNYDDKKDETPKPTFEVRVVPAAESNKAVDSHD
jgi:glutamate synthase domain-containing protein 3